MKRNSRLNRKVISGAALLLPLDCPHTEGPARAARLLLTHLMIRLPGRKMLQRSHAGVVNNEDLFMSQAHCDADEKVQKAPKNENVTLNVHANQASYFK